MARITSIATANPPHRVDEDQAEALLFKFAAQMGLNPSPLRRILQNTQIASRHTTRCAEELYMPMSLKDRNDLYMRQCLELGERVTLEAIERAGLTPADIDSVISVSCTGHMIPSIEAYLINQIGLSPNIRRRPLTELGCIAGAVAVAQAWEELQVYPDSNVLLLAIELPSLTFQPNDLRLQQLISSMIFTDGAAAVVVSKRSKHPSPALLGRRMYTIGNTIEDMGYNLDDAGLHIVLSPAVPGLIEQTLPGQVDALLKTHGLTRSDLKWFAIHPAGPKVLELIEEAMMLPHEKLAASWKVMQQYGNMSSAAVLFVLNEMLTNPPADPGDYGIIVAFGPGVSGEIVLARWEE
jgi:alkylresorcinol/alkylpyrone synthase